MTTGNHAAPAPERTFAADGLEITIRPLTSNEDARACVELQRDIWGFEIGQLVPESLIHVVGHVGGLAAGAFNPAGELIGFTLGISGVRNGTIVHWSHMLAVRAPERDSGIGRLLKEYQRSVLAKLGIVRIFWTFDPLQSKNAYLNFNRLGVEVDEYVQDMYGNTGSPLHLGLPTDRLVVHVAAGDRTPRSPKVADVSGLKVLTAVPRRGDDVLEAGSARPPQRFLVEIPYDVNEVTSRSVDEALSWRLKVRDAFLWALGLGYVVDGVHRDRAASRTFYVLERNGPSA